MLQSLHRRACGVAAMAAGVLIMAGAPTALAAPAAAEPVVPDSTPTVTETAVPPTAPADDLVAGADAPSAGEAAPRAAPEPAATLRSAAGTPAVSVSPTTGLAPAGGSAITVSGTGFDPNANNGFGVYAVFGPVDPGTYFKDANRFLAAMWMHRGGGSSGSPGQGELQVDGSFRATLPPAGGLALTAQYTDGNGQAVNCLTTQCYVVTMAAHGVDDRSQDTCTPVAFAGATAVPTVDSRCQPLTTPTGGPTGGSSGNPAGGGNSTGSDGTNASGTRGSTANATLPRTGSMTAPLTATGAVLVLGGAALCAKSRRHVAPVRVDRSP